jgi:hypothetical protein
MDTAAQRDSVSLALLALLERPIAAILDLSEANCRKQRIIFT